MGDTGYEMWVVPRSGPVVVEHLTLQLPIKADLQALREQPTPEVRASPS
jgi:hypothetical protein